MKHLAKNIYIKKLDKYNFELLRKYHPKGKNGELAVDDSGNIRVAYSTLGYYSNWERVWGKIKDLGMEEWINGDVNSCRMFIKDASSELKEYFNDIK